MWSYILTLVGITGFYLAGRKVWWCWYINIANQVLWLIYAVITQQWGFILGTVFYSVVFIKNAYQWTKERGGEKGFGDLNKPIGRIEDISVTATGGLVVTGKLNDGELPGLFRNGTVVQMSVGMMGVDEHDGIWVTRYEGL